MPQQRGWQDFLKLCQESSSDTQLNSLLHFFLTAEEREQISMRVELVRALLKGEISQREIAKKLKISIAKITRGSNALKEIDKSLRDYLLIKL